MMSAGLSSQRPVAAPAPVPMIEPLLAPTRLDRLRDRAIAWLGIGLSIAILAAVFAQLRGIEFARVVAMAPGLPTFWLIFAAAYLLGPASEWVIYRRLWRLPPAGIVPLLRKQVSNELVLGYSGDAQFYLWARRHAEVCGSPFGAIKDVAMLSAVAGNVATLGMMLVMAPLLWRIADGTLAHTFMLSIAVIVATSLMLFAFRSRLFSLPARDLLAIFAIHLGRVALSLLLTATMWRLLLPGVALDGWLALATLRLMLSRVPLLPNKDVLFAGLTILLLGARTDIAAVMAFMASLGIAANLAVGAVAGLHGVIERRAGR